MQYHNIQGVPDFISQEFASQKKRYAVLIPIINEGNRILHELQRACKAKIWGYADIILCDGGSSDGSTAPEILRKLHVNTLLIKQGEGKQGAQLRMGIWWALQKRHYDGIITIDGNDKDSIESVPSFIRKLEQGYAFVQGSRYVSGGKAIHTPIVRTLALRLLHAPVISLTAKHFFTDTTNAFRGYSRTYLEDDRVQPLRDIFMTYELLAYLSVRASQLGYPVCEIPVTRAYPANQKTPTKISFFRGNAELLLILFRNAAGAYQPEKEVHHEKRKKN